jgi:putative flavoprotein involved in K+ transport
MTATMNQAETATTVTAWLSQFEDAMAAGNVAAAAELFAADCYWRDLIAFTWNLKTVEGPAGVADLLNATLESVRPRDFRIAAGEEPSDTDGLIEAWIEFETAVGRGRGQLRLRDGKAWTLLTTLYELTGFEEPARSSRPLGAEHGVHRHRETWADRREREARELGYKTQPYVLVVGGGQGGIALGARLRQLGVPTIIVDKGQMAKPLQVTVPARPGLV